MKTTEKKTDRDQRLTARFAPEVEFELTPLAGAVSPEAVRIKFQELQSRLVEESLSVTQIPSVRIGIRRAALEAAALSWTTPFPLLVMPVLFLEKTRETRRRLEKQQEVRWRSERLVETVDETEKN